MNDFKIGDIVRVKEDPPEKDIRSFCISDATYTIIDITYGRLKFSPDDEYNVSYNHSWYFDSQNFELSYIEQDNNFKNMLRNSDRLLEI